MVSRSLTEVFVLMRNNAIHSRQIFSDQPQDSERVELIRSNANDLEAGVELSLDSNIPPSWSDVLEETQYIITRLRSKLSELQTCHEKQIWRPALDDSSEQQHIDRLTVQISRHFTEGHSRLTAIKAQVRDGNRTEQKLASNVVLALVTTFQDLSVTFRTAQANYLKSITSREERSNAYFDLPNFGELSLNDNEVSLSNQIDLLFSLPSSSGMQNFEEDVDGMFHNPVQNQRQLLLMQKDNTKMVAEREEEVNKIVRSIMDLNEIFKDLGHMVHEQGTILDRIDYNIEHTQVQVNEGYKQLQKAERYQRKNRKMHCIFILAITLVVMVVLLIITKS